MVILSLKKVSPNSGGRVGSFSRQCPPPPTQFQYSRQQESRGKQAPCRANYLLCQDTETQQPVLSLLQGSMQLNLTKLQGQSSLSDLAQVAGAQSEQVLVQVGGRRYFMDITQGLAVRDRRPRLPQVQAHTCAYTQVHMCTAPTTGPTPSACLHSAFSNLISMHSRLCDPQLLQEALPNTSALIPPTLKPEALSFQDHLFGAHPQPPV